MSQLPNNSASFPPAYPTPNSFGQTFHKHNFETNGLSNHLNVNNDNDGVWTGDIGGFQFSTINSTLTEPIELLTVNTNGVTIDKSVQGGATLVNLPSIIVGQPTQVVFSFPPALDTFGIQYGVFDNPVQVLFNAGVFTTGTTYYARATNAQTLEIRTTTTPSDPPLDCSVFTFGQVPFAYVTGNTPSTIQTININDDIVLTTGTKSCSLSATLLRNNTIKTTLDMDNNTLQFVDALGTTSNVMAAGFININNEPENVGLGLANNRFFITQTNTNLGTNIYAGQVQQTDLPNNNQTVLTTNYLDVNLLNTNQKSSLTSNSLTIRDLTTNVSILSPTDLTFNGVSLPSTVSTNTTNIGTNTTNIATNTTNINTLQIKQTTTANQYISAIITADARPPISPTTTITQQFAFSPAWYFKNSFASNNKINWYLGGDIGMTVSQVLGLYMNIFNTTMVSNDLPPYITIYTTNDTPSPPNFYKSKRTYIFNQSVTPVVNTRYLMFQDVSGTCPTPFHYGSVLNNMELSTVAGSNVGAFGASEVILAFAIGTNSAAAINTVEFAVSKFGIMTPYGTQEVLFIPST
jgi:hypothetical protein